MTGLPLLVACLAVTSLAGYWLGRTALGFDRVSLASVLRSALECLGTSVTFLAGRSRSNLATTWPQASWPKWRWRAFTAFFEAWCAAKQAHS